MDIIIACILTVILAESIAVWRTTVVKRYNKGLCLRYLNPLNLKKAFAFTLRIKKMNKIDDPENYQYNYHDRHNGGGMFPDGFDGFANGMREMKHNARNTPKLDSEKIKGLDD